MSRDDIRRIGTAARKAGEASFAGKSYALIVIVRELDEGAQLHIETNVVGDRPAVMQILKESSNAVRNAHGVVI
jgi:hypothetical protein